MIIYALITGGAVTAIAVVALLIAYAVARYALDRRRLAAWELAWAWTGAQLDRPPLTVCRPPAKMEHAGLAEGNWGTWGVLGSRGLRRRCAATGRHGWAPTRWPA